MVGLKADVNFVKSNKKDFQIALRRLGSTNKLRSSLKTVRLQESYISNYKIGSLPKFYVENNLKLQQTKDEEVKRREEEQFYNENKYNKQK